MKRRILLFVILATAIAVAGFVAYGQTRVSDEPKRSGSIPAGTDVIKSEAKTKPTPQAFDKKAFATSDPASLWVVANKRQPLDPKDYTPRTAAPDMKLRLSASQPEMQVSTAMRGDLEAMAAAAAAAKLPLMLASGYRSYQTQVSVYGNEVKTYGQAEADRQSARPGHSEHQTGLAVDLAPAAGNCLVADCFGDTPEGKWLAAHAYEYGFVIRYPEGKENITGYRYEPWHVRYVGRQLASELHKQGTPVLETFFGLPAAPDYL